MRRLVLATALLAATAAVPLATSTAAPAPTCGPQSPSWLAGSVDLCAGTLTYRDYVYDDYGADDPAVPAASRSSTGSLSRSAGDARYPVGLESTADLVDLTLRADRGRLLVTAELTAMTKPGQALVALAVDTDGNPRTGGGAWPGVKEVRSAGWDRVVVLKGGDPRTNTVTGSLPLPKASAFRVQALTAQPDGTVMNVAFRGTGEKTVTGAWWEDDQAAALARGDVSAFGHTVRRADLVDKRTARARQDLPGFHQRVYTSRYTLPGGEGMTYTAAPGAHGSTGTVCEQGFHFLGKYQPYGVYVPKPRATRPGVQLTLHGCNANHSSLVDQPGMQQQFGEDLNRVVVTPLGRGPVGYYSDISERDVLDVMDDVKATYRPDADRWFSGGYSMGGYGAYRFAQLYPHRFAGMVNWVGFTGDVTTNPVTDDTGEAPSGAIGDVSDYVGNLRHVPSALLYAAADELVQVNTALGMEKEFQQHEVPYEFFLHPNAEHLTFALLDSWEKEAEWLKDRRLVRDPSRVTYRTHVITDAPRYGIRHDRAYWVSGIRSRVFGYADVDLTSGGCGATTPTYETGNRAGVGPAAVGWVSTNRTLTGQTKAARAQTLTGSLKNVEELQVSVPGACLRGPVDYRVTTDGPTQLRLSDGRSVQLPGAGEHTGTLR